MKNLADSFQKSFLHQKRNLKIVQYFIKCVNFIRIVLNLINCRRHQIVPIVHTQGTDFSIFDRYFVWTRKL